MPDFCKNSSILMLVISLSLLAIVIELLDPNPFNFNTFALTAIYIFWIGLSTAGLLCLLNRRFSNGLSFRLAVIISLVVFVLIEGATQLLYLTTLDFARFSRLFVIAALIIIVCFRIFYLLNLSNNRARLEASHKLTSLQSKMAPHFLFNCLNTIAELVHLSPDKAERAIQNLSALLRVSVNDHEYVHSLKSEISLCKKYVALEQLRLGDRLKIDWNIEGQWINFCSVPKLLLQPLLENAIVHGVAKHSAPGQVTVSIYQLGNRVKILVENDFPEVRHSDEEPDIEKYKKGLGIALPNIRERLFVIYDDQSKLAIKHDNQRYSVAIEIPSKPKESWIRGQSARAQLNR